MKIHREWEEHGVEEKDEELKPKAVEKQLFGCSVLCSIIILQCEYYEKFIWTGH